MQNQATALPADVGLCACNARNSLRATRCHSCGVTLPWVQQKPEPKPKVSPTTKPATALNTNVNISIDSDSLVVWGIGIVVFIVAFIFPIIGFWMYRYFSSDESPLANFAAAGGLIGLAIWIWVGMDNSVNRGSDSSLSR